MWGEALTAFPAVGTELDDFAAHVVVDPGPVPTLETPILLARQFGAHWHVLLPGAAATSVEVDRFLVMAQNEDALLCTFANEPTNDFREWVTVAKPFELRYSSWHIDGVAMRVHCENLDVWMTYTHLASPSPLSQRYKRRIVTRDDEPGNPYIEVIVPEWRFYTFDSVPPDNLWATIWAAKVGVEITGREFADWQDLNLAGRQWALLGRQDEPP
jgi:hypothetical protein